MYRMLLVLSSVVVLSMGAACGRAKISSAVAVEALVTEAPVDTAVTQTPEESERAEVAPGSYRGEPVAEDGDVKVYVNYALPEHLRGYGDDIMAKDETYLVRYVGEEPRDTMVLVGPYTSMSGSGNMCRIAVGTDTVKISLRQPFGQRLDLRYAGVLPECSFHRWSQHYRLSETSFPTDFQINIAMRDNEPEWMRRHISELIRDDVAGYFTDHSGDRAVVPYIALYDAEDWNATDMSRHYYRNFTRLYRQENVSEEDNEMAWAPPCSYQTYVYPVWESPDSAVTTWRFYNYGYSGGAHGWEHEYYVSFDNATGRMLGAEDFYTSDGFNEAIDHLTRMLNEYFGKEPYGDYSMTAHLDEESDITATQSTILNEVAGGHLYPRPARTRQGIVFTYQTYEKGGNSDGVLHFIQPYENMGIASPGNIRKYDRQ